MILLIALIAIAIWATVATVLEVRRDGYRPADTDWSRVASRDSLHQAQSGHVYR